MQGSDHVPAEELCIDAPPAEVGEPSSEGGEVGELEPSLHEIHEGRKACSEST